MTEDLGFGKLITTHRERDAIHVAVAPVVAGCLVNPADRVGFLQGGRVGPTVDNIGIIDPYLTEPVLEGQTCWLFLFPNTVTGLRHHWSHPAFGPEGISPPSGCRDPEGVSRRWIEDFAGRIGQSYCSLMDAAQDWIESDGDNYTRDDRENYKNDWESFGEFWKHYEIVTGTKVTCEKLCFFSCSC